MLQWAFYILDKKITDAHVSKELKIDYSIVKTESMIFDN